MHNKDVKHFSNRGALTFGEIYNRKRIMRVRSSTSTVFPNAGKDMLSLERCKEELAAFAQLIEINPETSISKMNYIVNNLPKQLHGVFMEWLDPRGMDVLHLCIVFDRPETIALMLESDLFPHDYSPACNPYAHLAAVLGHKACLEVLLVHRPNFYFKTSKAHHTIKLDKATQVRFRIKDGTTSINKSVQKMIKKVGQGPMQAEKSMDSTFQKRSSYSEMDILDVEMANSKEKPTSRRRQSRRLSVVSFDPLSLEKQRRQTPSVTYGRDGAGSINTTCRKPFQKGEHVIIMHSDELQDEAEGVVKEAGHPVRLLRADEVNITPPKLPVINDVRVLGQRSIALKQRAANASVMLTSRTKLNSKLTSTFNLKKSEKDVSNNAYFSSVSSNASSPFKTRSLSSTTFFRRIELGVRKIKKYKDFQLVIDSRTLKFKDDRYMNKTPLALAAERGHMDCVKYLLQNYLLKHHPTLTSQEPLTLAAKARSPEAIAILMTGKYSRDDFQSAILASLREFYPACLTVLLWGENRDRTQMFDGENLFHILFSQGLNSDYRYEMLPEMTRTLINCKEEVNAHGAGSIHPMYTLISCAFNIKAGRQCLYYLESLKILLAAKANPHFNELRDEATALQGRLRISRQFFLSAIHCVFSCAARSKNFLEKPYWSKLIMQKFIECIVVNDRTTRRIQNDVLFHYVEHVNHLGLDRKILRSLFRYGANPDFQFEGKYAVNAFFDERMLFLKQYQVTQPVDSIIDPLMMLCNSMSQGCLQEALRIFLDEHLLLTPLQALPLTRRFCAEVNKDVRNPRSLVALTANYIWKSIKCNTINAKKLPASNEILALIIPG